MFACGNYISTHPIENNAHVYDDLHKMTEKLERELNETVNRSPERELEVFKLSKKLYKACMDVGEPEGSLN